MSRLHRITVLKMSYFQMSNVEKTTFVSPLDTILVVNNMKNIQSTQ